MRKLFKCGLSLDGAHDASHILFCKVASRVGIDDIHHITNSLVIELFFAQF